MDMSPCDIQSVNVPVKRDLHGFFTCERCLVGVNLVTRHVVFVIPEYEIKQNSVYERALLKSVNDFLYSIGFYPVIGIYHAAKFSGCVLESVIPSF